MGGELAESKLIGGRYALESLLGQGGMGEVWRARHIALNSGVAIKFLAGTSAQKQSTRKRFLTEAQVTAQLKTRHAVQVFDFGITDEGQPYLVMELLDGETLGHRVTRLSRLDVASTVRFLEQAARALERAHALGIVHRDFKPDNVVIVLDEEGRENIKVLDFGIAKLLHELDASDLEDAEPMEPTSKAFATFTRTGTVLGTPLYMAPEQVRNAADLDLRADIWAFGVVAFQCLTGIPPFEGKSLIELFERIAKGEHPTARSIHRDLPQSFDDWFAIACSPDATKRFASAKIAAAQLAIALESALPSGELRLTDTGSGRDLGRGLQSSGERPVLERAATSSRDSRDSLPDASPLADALSQTLEAPHSRRGAGVKATERLAPKPEQETPNRFGRVASVPPPPPAGPSMSTTSDHAVTSSRVRAQRRGRKRVTLWAVAAALPLIAIATYKAGLLGGATAPTPPAPTQPASTASPSATTPPASAAAVITPPTMQPIAATPPEPAHDAGAATATTPLMAGSARPLVGTRPPVGGGLGATPPPTATIATATATVAPPPAPPPPTAAPPPAASGASPFKLPPLGI